MKTSGRRNFAATVAGPVFAVAVTSLSAPLTADAQPAGKVYRIGVLVAGGSSTDGATPGRDSSILQPFREGLRELGWIEGKNIVIDYRFAEGRYDRLSGQLLPLEARDPKEFEDAFAAMAKERVDALLVLAETIFNVHRARLVELAAKNRLPVMYGGREYVEVGGLISYRPNLSDLFRRAPSYVDKILKGAKPADMPVEQPTKFELFVNLRTAKALALTIPGSILVRANQIIE